VHGQRRERVDGDEHIDIGADRDETVGGNERLRTRGRKSERVDLDKTETVRLGKALSVGGLYQVGVGGAMNTTVAGAQLAQIAGAKSTTVAKSYVIDAGDLLAIDVGAAHLRLSKDGAITLSGTRIDISASGPVRINGQVVEINNGGTTLAGGAGGAGGGRTADAGTDGKPGEQKDGAGTPTTTGAAQEAVPDNRKLLNDADAALRSQPAVTRAEDLKNIASPADAPKTIVISGAMQQDFNALWDESHPGGTPQEFGATLVTDKNGELSLANMGTTEKTDSFTPNLTIPPDKAIVGTFHTHPYGPPADDQNYTDVSFSGTDAEYMVDNNQDLSLCQSGTGQFAFVRTQQTPNNITSGEAVKMAEDEKNNLVKNYNIGFPQATQMAAEDVAERYHLAYYQGENGVLTLNGD
jgi:hypothetical protein